MTGKKAPEKDTCGSIVSRKERTMEKVKIFDTTLRDGEQSPGCRMDVPSKILVAEQLERLKVDVIEAGFPIASEQDFQAVSQIAQIISGSVVCALSRTKREDIEKAAKALEKAKMPPRIHTFVATSEIHMREKLRKEPQEILDMVGEFVSLARQYIEDVEFSPEDAARSGKEFLAKVVRVAIEAGATTINIPDTVGYSVGREFFDLIKYLKEEVPQLNSVVISAHCHNDLGLAVSNTLAAVEAGARQVECCVLGIGERAGNAQLEAVVMALKTRKDYYGVEIGVNTKELGRTAKLVASVIKKPISDTLPVVGGNAFSHGAGIHQHGVLQHRLTYEIMKPEDVGWQGESMPLVKHSGRHALRRRLENLGYGVDEDFIGKVYKKFIDLADTKTYVYNEDIYLLVQEILIEKQAQEKHLIKVERVDYHRTGSSLSAIVTLSKNSQKFEASGSGDGPAASVWDAVVNAVSRQGILPQNLRLRDFNIGKGAGGVEAVGLVTLSVESNGNLGYGRGSDTDIVAAFAKALIAAINHLLYAPVKEH